MNKLIKLPANIELNIRKETLREVNQLMDANPLAIPEEVEEVSEMIHNLLKYKDVLLKELLKEKRVHKTNLYFKDEKIKELTEVIQRNAARKS